MAKKGNRQRQSAGQNKNNDVLGVILIVISVFFLICIVIPPILGVVSWSIFGVLLGVFGIMIYPILIALLLRGIFILLKREPYLSVKNIVCIILIAIFAMMILQLASTHAFLDNNFRGYISNVYHAKYSAGGVIFGTLAFGLKSAITEVGCYILFSVALIITTLILIDVVGRIRRRAAEDVQDVIPAPERNFMSEGEAQRVVPVDSPNKLFVGLIENKANIRTESGIASEIPQSEPRAVTDYNSSPIIERYDSEGRPASHPSAARYALYGAADSINEQETEEFRNKPTQSDLVQPQDAPVQPVPPVAPATPPVSQSAQEPYLRVNEDAKQNTAKPRNIDHDESPDLQIFFPAQKKIDFNPSDDIISDGDLAAGLQQDSKKLKLTDIENINAGRAEEPPFAMPDFSVRPEPQTPYFENIDDILSAPVVQSPEEHASSSLPLNTQAPPAQDEREDIIDAFALRDMYAEEPQSEPEPQADDIITSSAAQPVHTPPPAPPAAPIFNYSEDDGIINAEVKPGSAEPAQSFADDIIDGNTGGTLTISDEPAIDLSETHDNTSDLIDGDDLSGMYVTADDEPPVPVHKPKPRRNAPIEDQVSIDTLFQEQAESVVLNNTVRRKKYNYAPPPLDLLKTYEKSEMSEEDLRAAANTLEAVIGGFLKADVKVINIVPGPTVTRYELEVPSGVSVKQIESRAQDIEYELATISHIRIEAPIPGKRAVGIEIPNTTRSIVGLREIIESHTFTAAKSSMTFSVGKDISGGVVLCDLVKIPHLLIAGQTGSGKSACLNGLLVSLLYKSSPEDLRFILVDPKRVEFSAYQGMPHLLFNQIIYEPNEVLNALKWASNEMERRYALMAKYGRNNLASYNDLPDVTSGKIDKLPHIIVIVDELADIMQSSLKRDIEDRIKVIAAKARAAGIHLIVATQRPSSDVITGTIKANLTSRIAFRVSSQIDSRIILDAVGAETLVGNGDMLFFPVGDTNPRRIQGSYISDIEVSSVITYIKEHYECDFDEEAAKYVFSSGNSGGDDGGSGGDAIKEDPLLLDVLALIIKSGQASTSGIQRRFSIGYARAARIMDILEELGYIGPTTNNNKPREVRITAETFREKYGRDIEEN